MSIIWYTFYAPTSCHGETASLSMAINSIEATASCIKAELRDQRPLRSSGDQYLAAPGTGGANQSNL